MERPRLSVNGYRRETRVLNSPSGTLETGISGVVFTGNYFNEPRDFTNGLFTCGRSVPTDVRLFNARGATHRGESVMSAPVIRVRLAGHATRSPRKQVPAMSGVNESRVNSGFHAQGFYGGDISDPVERTHVKVTIIKLTMEMSVEEVCRTATIQLKDRIDHLSIVRRMGSRSGNCARYHASSKGDARGKVLTSGDWGLFRDFLFVIRYFNELRLRHLTNKGACASSGR